MRELITRAKKLIEDGSEDRQPLYDCIDDLLTEHAALTARVEVLEDGMQRIEAWEMPETGKFHEDGTSMSYNYCFGSLGERAHIREIARNLLAGRKSVEAA